MRPTLPERRLYDADAPNYMRVQKNGLTYGLKLTGDKELDDLIRQIAFAAEGYGISGRAPQVIIRDRTGKVVS